MLENIRSYLDRLLGTRKIFDYCSQHHREDFLFALGQLFSLARFSELQFGVTWQARTVIMPLQTFPNEESASGNF
jgi:hypothetical protein